NNGPDGASGVQLIDLLPAGVSYLSDAPSQGTYTSAAGLWDVGAILVSDSATLHVLAAVDLGTVDQTIVNSATIASANQADPDTTDNSATASITVGPSEMRVASGSYTGDGADDRAIAGIGFEPDVVIVKGDLSESALVRTSTMNGDVSRELGEKSALLPDLIQSLDPDGFTVGTSDGVNKSGVTYYWTAFRAAKREMVVGSYPGNGVDDRSITGLPFGPTYVIVLNEAAEDAMQRFAAQSGDASLPFRDDAPKADRIQAIEPNGFQIGRHATTNKSGDTYHYIAWNSITSRVQTGMYLGNDTDDRHIAATSFRPDFLLVQRSENGSAGVIRNLASSGDHSLPVDAGAAFGDRIQAFLPDGFQVGGDPDVNQVNDTYHWAAFKDSRMLDVAVTKGVDNPAPNAGDRVEFTITVMNNGPVDATGVQVRDVLPAGLTYDSDAPSVGTYDSGTGVWDVGPLSNGVANALLLRARVDADAGGSTIVNTASLWSVDQIDVAAANNTGTASVTVTSADLEISASVDNAYPAEGDTIAYLIRLANRGPDDATAVTVTDSLPLGVAYMADSTSAGTYDTTTGVWNVGNLPSGSADTLLIYARIDAGTMGSYITNAAFITGSAVADPDSSNNADSVTVLVPTPVALDDT
ncbi:MAG: DUF11 domain-containing protein, partial [Candidatus Krumholzibacteria bacterium]|nr:DUF11 domain-containing protein [Candidatus Krumholzibacteria bacterium]